MEPFLPWMAGALGLVALVLVVWVLRQVTGARASCFCPAGQWTPVIANFGTGMPRDFQVQVKPRAGGAVAGRFREYKYLWIIPQAAREGDLTPHALFHRDWINAVYRLEICPATDADVAIS